MILAINNVAWGSLNKLMQTLADIISIKIYTHLNNNNNNNTSKTKCNTFNGLTFCKLAHV